jgi:hypothetical protein
MQAERHGCAADQNLGKYVFHEMPLSGISEQKGNNANIQRYPEGYRLDVTLP